MLVIVIYNGVMHFNWILINLWVPIILYLLITIEIFFYNEPIISFVGKLWETPFGWEDTAVVLVSAWEQWDPGRGPSVGGRHAPPSPGIGVQRVLQPPARRSKGPVQGASPLNPPARNKQKHEKKVGRPSRRGTPEHSLWNYYFWRFL